MGVCVKVTGLLSQGRGKGDEWVTAFLVSYSLDAYHWLYIADQYGNQRVNLYAFLLATLHSSVDETLMYLADI